MSFNEAWPGQAGSLKVVCLLLADCHSIDWVAGIQLQHFVACVLSNARYTQQS